MGIVRDDAHLSYQPTFSVLMSQARIPNTICIDALTLFDELKLCARMARAFYFVACRVFDTVRRPGLLLNH